MVLRLLLAVALAAATVRAAGDADGRNSGPEAQILRLNPGEKVSGSCLILILRSHSARRCQPGPRFGQLCVSLVLMFYCCFFGLYLFFGLSFLL